MISSNGLIIIEMVSSETVDRGTVLFILKGGICLNCICHDAKDGTKRWVTEVIANSVEFIERKATGSGAPVQSGDAGPKSEMESFGSAVPFDEEIPF